MLQPVFQFFERLVVDFSWKRFTASGIIILMIVGSFVGYEYYTGTFRLSRIEKEVGLLERLSKLSEKEAVENDSLLASTYERLSRDLSRSGSADRIEIKTPSWLKKVIAAFVPWVILSVLLSLTESFDSDTLAGMIIIALPFLLIAGVLPSYQKNWINYWLYPIGHMLLVLVAIIAWQRLQSTA